MRKVVLPVAALVALAFVGSASASSVAVEARFVATKIAFERKEAAGGPHHKQIAAGVDPCHQVGRRTARCRAWYFRDDPARSGTECEWQTFVTLLEHHKFVTLVSRHEYRVKTGPTTCHRFKPKSASL